MEGLLWQVKFVLGGDRMTLMWTLGLCLPQLKGDFRGGEVTWPWVNERQAEVSSTHKANRLGRYALPVGP